MNTYIDIIFCFLIAIFANYLIMLHSHRIISFKTQKQNIHIGLTPPLGGISIIALFYFYNFTFDKIDFDIFFYLSSCLIIIPAIFEDFGIETKPILRLLLIFIGSFFLILNTSHLPEFNFDNLNVIFNNKYFQIIFFTVALATVINGQNLIDGTNGLSGFTALVIFICIGYLGYLKNNNELLTLSLLICSLIVAFLIFNYPFGKIFMGDSGCYFIGLLSGYSVIKIFATYPELPTWSAAIILFYPAIEVVFSYFRKIMTGVSPFKADKNHLHLKIFFLISANSKRYLLCNSLVAPILGLMWISPLILLPISLVLPHTAVLILFVLIVFYIVIYFNIPNN